MNFNQIFNSLQPILPFLLVIPLVAVIVVVLVLAKKRKDTPIVEEKIDDPVFLQIQVPWSDMPEIGVTKTAPIAAEQMFASLHGLLREDAGVQEHFTFEITSDAKGIRFFAVVPRHIYKFVESQIYAQYPEAHIERVDDYAIEPIDKKFEVAHMNLLKNQIFPIKTFRDFEVDPLAALTSALSEAEEGETVWLQLLVRPIADVWQEEGYDYVKELLTGKAVSKRKGFNVLDFVLDLLLTLTYAVVGGIADALAGSSADSGLGSKQSSGPSAPEKPELTGSEEVMVEAIETKLEKMGFEVSIRILASSNSQERSKNLVRSFSASMRQFSTSNLNSFITNHEVSNSLAFEKYKARTFSTENSYVLNITEMASIFHLPTSNVETPNMSWIYSKKGEPPSHLPTENCCYIGRTTYRGQSIAFGIDNTTGDRLRHMYLIGKTGVGKSTLFETMITQDIYNGFGVGVLDPHGELIDHVLEYIPDHRLKDVIIVDPSDTAYPVGINLLEIEDQSQKNLMASALVSAIKVHFEYSWGPRLEYLLNYAILTLLEVPGTTMLSITRLLGDMNYQKYILHYIKDPVVLEFWEKEYAAMRGNAKLATEAVAPIQNKINRFLASTTIRNILGQPKSTINIWDAMNTGKILLLNLSKGKVGEDNANLLGALLVSRIQFMALQRAKLAPEQRREFYLYVDEFQNFATGSFESILSESRKYKLGLYLTHQYTSQLPDYLLSAVLGNVGTIAAFGLGASDARLLANEFAPQFTPNDIISLDKYNMYIKMVINGTTSLPFSAKSVPPFVPRSATNRERALQLSRQNYGTDRRIVEERIRRWVDRQFDKGLAISQEHKARKAMETEKSTGHSK
ncbi:MAG: type IV secretory system conjugative DNA transfer family protein [Patescibacteria group bacterium]